jgi:hypothetical protein
LFRRESVRVLQIDAKLSVTATRSVCILQSLTPPPGPIFKDVLLELVPVQADGQVNDILMIDLVLLFARKL